MEFQAFKFSTVALAEKQLIPMFNYYKGRNKIRFSKEEKWGNIIVGIDGTALIVYDKRIEGFSPGKVEIFNTEDENYFSKFKL